MPRDDDSLERHGHVWVVSRRKGLLALVAAGLAMPVLLSRRSRGECMTTFLFNSEGPFFLGDARDDEPTGHEIALMGSVSDRATCAPIAGARVVRWHTNKHGIYDEFFNTKLLCDVQGKYRIQTIVPGEYNGVARHVHFEVSAPGYKTLTTRWQVGDSENPQGDIPFDFVLDKA